MRHAMEPIGFVCCGCKMVSLSRTKWTLFSFFYRMCSVGGSSLARLPGGGGAYEYPEPYTGRKGCLWITPRTLWPMNELGWRWHASLKPGSFAELFALWIQVLITYSMYSALCTLYRLRVSNTRYSPVYLWWLIFRILVWFSHIGSQNFDTNLINRI